MEEKISFKELLKICKECSISIFFISVIFGLIYGVYSLISMNWDQYIFPILISPVLMFFYNFLPFIEENSKLISFLLILINFWFCCVVFKIGKKFKKIPVVISIFANLSFFTMVFMLLFNIERNNILQIIILTIAICVCISIYLNIQFLENEEELKNEKQLSLDLEEK
jgi:hypothetical protein